MNHNLSPSEWMPHADRKASPTSRRNQPPVRLLFTALDEYVRRWQLGRVWEHAEIVLDRREGLVLQPDITFIVEGRGSIFTDRVWGPPDMVLEVTSPLTRSGRLEERVAWFSMYGVREFWLLEAEQQELAVLELAHGGVRRRTLIPHHMPVNSMLLPEFNQSLAELFQS